VENRIAHLAPLPVALKMVGRMVPGTRSDAQAGGSLNGELLGLTAH